MAPVSNDTLEAFALRGSESLRNQDPDLHRLLVAERDRQLRTLILVASSSIVDPSVLACEASAAVNVTAEGYPGQRFHAGCGIIDQIEQLAIDRARQAFNAQYANVQPHCASSANEIIMFGLLDPGDTIMGMALDHGGHLTHGAPVSISGRWFNAVQYGLDEHGVLDYGQVRALARRHRPRLIVCGGTAYPRMIDFARFRAIADECGAFLLADITHTAGLVAAGLHASPVDHAHFTTMCTHKQLYGPRGGLILMGADAGRAAPGGGHSLAERVQRSVFPLMQGAPAPHVIAAKARALARVMTPEFRRLATAIVSNARTLADALAARAYTVVSAGTDSHIVLLDVESRGLTGAVAEGVLEHCDIIVNRNKVPGDRRPARITSGIRIGTNTVSARGMGASEMSNAGELIDRVLTSVRPSSDVEWTLREDVRREVRDGVERLCSDFPIPEYQTPRTLARVDGD
jgi:glycine hydroxymethyltransferase